MHVCGLWKGPQTHDTAHIHTIIPHLVHIPPIYSLTSYSFAGHRVQRVVQRSNTAPLKPFSSRNTQILVRELSSLPTTPLQASARHWKLNFIFSLFLVDNVTLGGAKNSTPPTAPSVALELSPDARFNWPFSRSKWL